MRLFIIIVFLLCPTLAFAGDILVTNGIIMHTGNVLEPGVTVTLKLQKPTNPSINDEYNDPRTGIVEVFNGTDWVVKNKTIDIANEIAIFKANLSGITDPKAKACIKALGKAILKLYKEEL